MQRRSPPSRFSTADPPRRLGAGCFAALFTILALTNVARAECPNAIDADREVDAIDDVARARWLRSFLESEQSDARLWNWGFGAVGAGGLALNLTWGALAPYDVRVARYFVAGSSAGLFLAAVVNPMRVQTDVPSDADLCVEVRTREKALVALAKDQARRQSVFFHVLPLVVAVGTGVALGAGFDQWRNGILNTAMSIFVSELRILTAPNGARTALRRYRHGDIGGDGAKAAWNVAPAVLGRDGAGLSLSVVY